VSIEAMTLLEYGYKATKKVAVASKIEALKMLRTRPMTRRLGVIENGGQE